MIRLTRMSGLSNACYRVQIEPKGEDENLKKKLEDLRPKSLLYREFECPIVDWSMENELFQSLSDQGIGPKLYFQNSEYRIEDFFLSRPLTIFEMRNEIFLEAYAEKICDFNYNKQGRNMVEKFIPKDQITGEKWIRVWGPEVKARIPSIREAMKNNQDILKLLDNYEETFLFEGYQDFFTSILPLESEIVLAHHDA